MNDSGNIIPRSAEFRRAREPQWRRLEGLLERLDKGGVSKLSAEETQELPLLYSAAVSSLTVARAFVLDLRLLLYLENLCLRAYLAVYGPRSGALDSLAAFFRRDFPRRVRSLGPHLALALFLLLAGTLAGFLLVREDPNYFTLLAPEELAQGRGPGSSREELLREELFAPGQDFAGAFIAFANALFRHNSMVGLLCFGLGFAFGLPVIFLLAYQGLILGAFLALHAARGLTFDFLAWLSIHGVTEMLAVLLCAAAGLRVAESILFPGALSRLDSLAQHGRAAASVAAGAVWLFFIAALIEGGPRQFINHTPGRLLFALFSLLLWSLYFLRAGRKD